MNSPIIPTVDAALLKAISVADDIHGEAGSFKCYRDTVRAVFRQEITTLKAALLAEHRSRQVALAELRATLDDEAQDLYEAGQLCAPADMAIGLFRGAITPWLDRLES